MREYVIDIFKYYAQFVPRAVLKRYFIQPNTSQRAGYEALTSEMLEMDDSAVMPDIGAYVCSINEKFISERIRNANKFILFVEYGKFNVDYTVKDGIEETLTVSVVHNFSDANNDNLNEVILMDACYQILQKIIKKMHADQNTLDWCADALLVEYPLEMEVIDPMAFYGCGGWCAKLKRINTELA